MRCARRALTVGVKGVTSPPIWLLALVMAALAPWAARALQAWLEHRLRRRTLDVLARAFPQPDRRRPGEPGDR